MKILLQKLTIIVLSLIISLLLGEGIIRLFYNRISNYNLEMWRYAKELKKPLKYNKLPFHHKSNVECELYGVKVSTNSLGFRDNEIDTTNEKIKRIIFIGDSFTFGWGVPSDKTYTSVLEKKLNMLNNEYDVINMGVGNYNSIMEDELFKLKGLQLNPKIVVLMYFINDVERTLQIHELKSKIFGNSYLIAFLFDKFQKIKLITNKNYNWKSYYHKIYSDKQAVMENKSSLEEVINICKQRNIKLLFVNIPELHELKNYSFTEATEYIKNIANDNNIPFLDLLEYIRDEKPSKIWVSDEDSHANAYANNIFANAIFEKLRNLGYVPE